MPHSGITKEEVVDLLEGVLELAHESDTRQEASAAHRLREKVLRNDFYLVLLGETSSGKSTFVNTVLGANLIPVSSSPTTGAIVFIQSDSECPEGQFFVLNADGTIGDCLTKDDFQRAAAGDSEVNRLLVKKSTAEEFPSALVMVDTPGFNSVVNQHLNTLHQCLPECDAILFLINYRKGVSPTDGKYLAHIAGILGENGDDRLLVLINFSTTTREDKRIKEIQSTLSGKAGFAGKTYVLKSERSNGRLRLCNEQLFEDLQALARNKGRELTLWRNALGISRGLLEQIGETLDVKRRIMFAEDEAIMRVKKRLLELQGINNSMLQNVLQAHDEMMSTVKKLVSEGKVGLQIRIDEALDEQSRWKDIDSARIYISGTVLDCGIQDLGAELSGYMDKRIRLLGDDLDGLADKGEDALRKLMEVDLPSRSTGIDQKVLGRIAGQAAGGGARWYLRGIAGAPGEAGVVGVMNLARKLMGQVNKLFKPILGENIFGREAMAKVGPLLKQFGATTARVAGFAAAAAVEAVVYLIKVAGWKAKLRNKLKPLVEDHCTYLEKESVSIIEDTLAATREMVKGNFVRRAEVISDALQAREAQRAVSPEEFEKLATRWNEQVQKVERALNNL